MFNPRVLDFRFQLSQYPFVRCWPNGCCCCCYYWPTGIDVFPFCSLALLLQNYCTGLDFMTIYCVSVFIRTQAKSTRVVMGCANAPERAKFISCVRINTLIGPIKARSLRNRLFHLFLVYWLLILLLLLILCMDDKRG